MKVTPLAIADVLLLEPKMFGDARGFFLESFNPHTFADATGVDCAFFQDNHSRSRQGVLRGLHYQLPPHAQGKLVRVAHGAVFDVAVDIRRGSPTFGQWVGAVLSGDNQHQLWIPPGMAHGFLVLSQSADFLYKATRPYMPQAERSIAFDDPRIGIDWPQLDVPFALSDKDRAAPALRDADLP